MGYYTTYSLAVKNVPTDKIDDLIGELKKKDLIGYAFCGEEIKWDETKKTNAIRFLPYDEVKWYEHDDDMVEISKKFPSMIFKLKGSGEDSGDLWYTLYQNGEYEECLAIITYQSSEHIIWDD